MLDDGKNFILSGNKNQAKDETVEPMCAQRKSIPFHEKHSWLSIVLPVYFLWFSGYDPSARNTHIVFHFVSCWSEMAIYDSNNSQAKWCPLHRWGSSYPSANNIIGCIFKWQCSPVTAARHFQYRKYICDVLKSDAHPLGEIADYGLKIEFFQRFPTCTL